MTKVAILTLPLSENYGGILQALALYSHVSAMGYEVTLLRKELVTRPLLPLTRIGRFLLENAPLQNRKGYRHRAIRRRANAGFISKHLPNRTEPMHTATQIAAYVSQEKIDAVIVGSDQVWRMAYIDDGHFDAFFLGFPKPPGMKKIAYAASFGVDAWEAPALTTEASRMLADFDAVSVRETSGLAICRNTFGREDCAAVADPTLLADPALFAGIARMPRDMENGAFLTYILDEDKRAIGMADALRQAFGKELPLCMSINGSRAYSIEEWLGAFHSAGFVVTDSFHGMIFSILFQKQFAVIGNRTRGMARFDSLLGMLGIPHRMIETIEGTERLLDAPIDYSMVMPKVQQLRASSRKFLADALPSR